MAGRLSRWFGGGRWKIWALWMGVAALVGGSLIYGSIVYTSRPKFCFECHLMEPYYNSWAQSSHKDVTCMACHAEPGVLGTMEAKVGGLKQLLSYSIGSYRGKLPQGYVSDENCMACHDRAALRDKAIDFQGMEFRHGMHFDAVGGAGDPTLKCTSCHTQVDEKAHITVDTATCFTCHMRTEFSGSGGSTGDVDDAVPGAAGAKFVANGIEGSLPRPLAQIGGDCRLCHERTLRENTGLAATHAPVLERRIDCTRCHGSMNAGADDPVSQDRCRRCHFESSLFVDRTDRAKMHDAHAGDVKIECIDCHAAVDHRSGAIRDTAAGKCNACHEDMHGPQQRMFLAASHEVPSGVTLPPFHAGLQCQSCHLDPQPVKGDPTLGQARVTTPDSCRTCHKGAAQGDFGRLLEKWKSGGAQAMESAGAHLDDVARALEAAPEAARDRAVRTLDFARQRLHLAEAARPVHNIHLARQVFADAGRFADEAATLGGVPVPAWVNPTANISADCARCHLAAVEGAPAGPRFFSHQKHLAVEGINCARCHNDEPRHGNLWVANQGCSDCHHQEQRDRCATCHPAQASLYDGGWAPGATERKNLMATEVHCVECHFPDDDRRTLKRPTREDCMKCHEKDVGVLLEDWRATVSRASEALEAMLKRAEAEDANLSVEQRKTVKEARSVLEFVRKDGSGGIHNPYAVEKALSSRTEALKAILGN